MSYTGESNHPSVLELARSGNFRAIAYWLNVFLLPHNLYARVESAPQSGCLQVLVECHPSPDRTVKSPDRSSLVRFICHHLWKLNSEVIEGVQITARFVGKPQVIWRQSARVLSPARRAKLGLPAKQAASIRRTSQIKSRVRQATRQKVQFRALRSLLLTGTTAAAFIMGCWLGYSDAPIDQTTASASPAAIAPSTRPNTVLTAMGNVPVETPDGVQNANDPTVTLMFGGDVTLTDAYTDSVGSDRQWAFSAMGEARQADVAMVNLEAPFTTAETPLPDKKFNFKVEPENVQVLKNGGIDLVTLANNHAMDYQAAGLEDTIKILDQAGIRHVGAGRTIEEARRPEILDVKGQRIAYLGYYDGDFEAAGEGIAGTNSRQNDRVAADIKAIRSQVDWIVVNYHWGEELAKYPGDYQMDLAHFTIDQGADLVVGHHPHVLQGAEIYKGRPIVYSLGNFIFGGKSVSDYDTAVLKVALKDKQMKVEFLPVEVRGFQPKVVSGDRGTEILHQIENVSDIFHEPMKSSVVLDAKTNTTVTSPASPSTPATVQNSPQPASPEIEQPIKSAPSPVASPSPQTPESIQPDASSPTPVAPDSGTPITSPSSPSDKPAAAPWKDDSFISTPSPSPSTPPLGSPTPDDSTPSPSMSPNQQGDASVPGVEPASIAPSPANSLEPMKKRYADSGSVEVAAASVTPRE
jgi:hypothetical protein